MRIASALILVGFLVIFFVYQHRSQKAPSESSRVLPTPLESPPALREQPPNLIDSTGRERSLITESRGKQPDRTAVKSLIPSQAQLRAEVTKNPHAPPNSLRRFSIAVGRRVLATGSLEEGSHLMSEFEDCVTAHDRDGLSPAQSIQAICLLNARKLSERFTSLSDRYQTLRAQASPTAAGFDQTMLRLLPRVTIDGERNGPAPTSASPAHARSNGG